MPSGLVGIFIILPANVGNYQRLASRASRLIEKTKGLGCTDAVAPHDNQEPEEGDLCSFHNPPAEIRSAGAKGQGYLE
jgi:hypothetical protein